MQYMSRVSFQIISRNKFEALGLLLFLLFYCAFCTWILMEWSGKAIGSEIVIPFAIGLVDDIVLFVLFVLLPVISWCKEKYKKQVLFILFSFTENQFNFDFIFKISIPNRLTKLNLFHIT